MKIRIFSIFLLATLLNSLSLAQSINNSKSPTYWIFLKDKCSALDFFDAPICEDYLNQLSEQNIELISQSKWLNAVGINQSDLIKALSFDFVIAHQAVGKYKVSEQKISEDFAYGKGDWQLEIIGLDSMHRLGFTGKNVTIAVFDGGFYNLDSIPAFDSLWQNNQIIASRDFVLNDSLRYNQSAHGMQVMSLMGAQYFDSLVGASPHANYVLARTEETGRETHSEEFNWINAMEWADSIGVDIIHSSLGYSVFDSLEGDYSYSDMDGNSTIITIAAELAASRGIFISNSAGNEGDDPWHYITAPCDGEHVLCVGAVDSFRQKAAFSSFGPSADGRVKPDVMAMGRRNTILSSTGVLRTGSGTSFSGPIIAGAVACLMQAHPNRSNEAIYQAIIQSCDKYSSPDSAYGYGIPNLIKADSILTSFVNISEIVELDFQFFPNPALSELRILAEPNSTYSICDAQAKVLRKGILYNWYNHISIADLSPGTYYISLQSKGQTAIKKLIKY